MSLDTHAHKAHTHANVIPQLGYYMRKHYEVTPRARKS